MTRPPDGCKDTGVPAIVTADPPGVIVVPARDIAVGLAVKTWFPTVYTWAGGDAAPTGRLWPAW